MSIDRGFFCQQKHKNQSDRTYTASKSFTALKTKVKNFMELENYTIQNIFHSI
jgi:hypothetical protein